jgi:hypothetical protein
LSDGKLRNPADWELQQLLEVWAVRHGLAYDVFEVPPLLSAADKQRMTRDLAKYAHIVSTEPWPNAWLIGAGPRGRTVDPTTSDQVQQQFERELAKRGWIATGNAKGK